MATARNLLEAKRGRLFRISPSASLADAAREFIEHGVSSLVVVDADRIVGLLTKNDLTRCCAERPDSLELAKVSEYMETDIFTTTSDADLDELIQIMVQKGFHHVPVSDDGKPVGMITYGDILASECSRLHGEERDFLRYIQGIY